MSIRLGIDASQPAASCAVSAGSEILAELTMDKPIENITVLIRKTLSLAQIGFENVDEIVVCTGPGSQTGMRTTVVAGNTLAMALGKPVVGVISVDAAAAAKQETCCGETAEVRQEACCGETAEVKQEACCAAAAEVKQEECCAATSKQDAFTVGVSAGRSRWFCADYNWCEGKLNRSGEIQLLDDLPEGVAPSFVSNSPEGRDNRSCAGGILIVAEEQRHLIVQPQGGIIVPYEVG